MKVLFAVSIFLVSVVSMAAATVKVTSFTYPRQGQLYAELCGQVQGAMTTPAYIKVAVDQTTSKSATYNTIAGTDGLFCISVVTYQGTAEVTVFGEPASAIRAFIQ